MLLCSRCGTAAAAIDRLQDWVAGRNKRTESIASGNRKRRTADCGRVRLAGCRERRELTCDNRIVRIPLEYEA